MHALADFRAECIGVWAGERQFGVPKRFLRRAEFRIGLVTLIVIRCLGGEPGDLPTGLLSRRLHESFHVAGVVGARNLATGVRAAARLASVGLPLMPKNCAAPVWSERTQSLNEHIEMTA